jgi:iron complex transport system ATP-binding protein
MSSGAEASCGPREAGVVLRLSGVSVVRDGRRILDGIHWTVRAGERWAVLGPNGSGKTTLLQIAGARLRPTEGEIEVLGSCIGRVDVRTLHTRVALVSEALVRQLRPTVSAREVVVTGRTGALEPWWHRYDHEDWAAADRLLSAGPLDSVFTSHAISNCFGVRVDVSGTAGGRWHVRATC